MPNRREYLDLLDRIEAARRDLAEARAVERPDEPLLAEQLNDLLDELRDSFMALDESGPDGGFAELLGIGPDAADSMDDGRFAPPVIPYDEAVTSERLFAIADLYYLYQHERIGVFRAVLKLQELFKAGRIRLSSGAGAMALYQFDRQRVLRSSRQERMQAYRRVFGYTDAAPPKGAQPNIGFHRLFTGFNNQVARFFRDKRISEVVRPMGRDLSFGSAAVVRRSGLDLRANLKGASYGHVNVVALEVSQLLERAFEILGAEDVRDLFGADTAWDVLDEVMRRHLGQQMVASQRSRMALTGRDIIRWLASPNILVRNRVEFEDLLIAVAEMAEEWLTSAESVGFVRGASRRSHPENVIQLRRRQIA